MEQQPFINTALTETPVIHTHTHISLSPAPLARRCGLQFDDAQQMVQCFGLVTPRMTWGLERPNTTLINTHAHTYTTHTHNTHTQHTQTHNTHPHTQTHACTSIHSHAYKHVHTCSHLIITIYGIVDLTHVFQDFNF